MENRELKLGNTPTPEELYALERAARAARAAMLAKAAAAAVAAVKNVLSRPEEKGLRHA